MQKIVFLLSISSACLNFPPECWQSWELYCFRSQHPLRTYCAFFPWQFTYRKLFHAQEFLADTGFLCDESSDAQGHDNPHAGGKFKYVGLKLKKEQCSSVKYLPSEFHNAPLKELTGGWPCYCHSNREKGKRGNLYSLTLSKKHNLSQLRLLTTRDYVYSL